jgi:Mn2+/Fe2+ NRAMP family transporter
MENNRKIAFGLMLCALACILMPAMVSASIASDIVKPMVATICEIYALMYSIAGGLGALVITISGFKWVGSAEDPGARKQAKDAIIHALIGMLLISIAVNIVMLITGKPDPCA